MKYPAYPKYKKSGVEWLGDVPEHWKIKKVKYVTYQVIDGTHVTPTYVDEGVPFLRVTDIQTQNIDLETVKFISEEEHDELKKRCNPKRQDVLLSKNGTIGITKVIDWDWDFSIFVSLCLIKLKKYTVNPLFFCYQFGSNAVTQQITEGTKQTSVINLHLDKIKELLVLLPPLPEQQTITTFLDHETIRIDSLIDKKQKLIELLKEKRTALISRTVTKGLNPTVKMKPSGVEWLGNVPEHWGVKKLKWMYRGIGSGDGISPDDIEPVGTYPVYGGNGIMGYAEKCNSTDEDIIIGRVGAKCGNVYLVDGPKWISDNALQLRITGLCKKYIALVLEERNLNQLANQNAQPLITGSMVGNQFMPLPLLPEQQDIVAFLDRETHKIDALVAKVATVIEKLKEYRTALISAAVTGKIDVSTGLLSSVREVA